MMGIIAALGAYALTGQIIPGIWWAYTLSGAIYTLSGL
jgi:hypothetical protein